MATSIGRLLANSLSSRWRNRLVAGSGLLLANELEASKHQARSFHEPANHAGYDRSRTTPGSVHRGGPGDYTATHFGRHPPPHSSHCTPYGGQSYISPPTTNASIYHNPDYNVLHEYHYTRATTSDGIASDTRLFCACLAALVPTVGLLYDTYCLNEPIASGVRVHTVPEGNEAHPTRAAGVASRSCSLSGTQKRCERTRGTSADDDSNTPVTAGSKNA